MVTTGGQSKGIAGVPDASDRILDWTVRVVVDCAMRKDKDNVIDQYPGSQDDSSSQEVAESAFGYRSKFV